MDRMSKITFLVGTIVFITLGIHIYIIIPIRIEEKRIETEDGSINKNILNKYLLDTYEKVSEQFIDEYIGKNTGTEIRGMYVRSWVRAYRITAPFMSKPFEVWIDNRTHEVFGDNFYSTLSHDPKFNHLYSEWVKKQIGIDDPNIELVFDRAKCGAQAIGDNISIDFSKINNKDNINEQICENIKNIYVSKINIKNMKVIDTNELLSFVDSIERMIRPYVFICDKKVYDRDNELVIFVNFNDANYKEITVCYDYSNDKKEYYDSNIYDLGDRDKWVTYN